MLTPPRSLFRERAMAQYQQRQQQTMLPRLVSPPVFLCSWILLSCLALAGGLAWWAQVPIFVSGSGVLQAQHGRSPSESMQVMALLFLPTSEASQVRVGQPVQLQLASTDLQFTGTVSQIEPGAISPIEARQRYDLVGEAAASLTQPSVVVVVKPATALAASPYAGSLVEAQIQAGTRSVLTLVPGMDQLIGG